MKIRKTKNEENYSYRDEKKQDLDLGWTKMVIKLDSNWVNPINNTRVVSIRSKAYIWKYYCSKAFNPYYIVIY